MCLVKYPRKLEPHSLEFPYFSVDHDKYYWRIQNTLKIGYFLNESISVHWCFGKPRKKGELSSHVAGTSIIHLNSRRLVNTFKVYIYIPHAVKR